MGADERLLLSAACGHGPRPSGSARASFSEEPRPDSQGIPFAASHHCHEDAVRVQREWIMRLEDEFFIPGDASEFERFQLRCRTPSPDVSAAARRVLLFRPRSDVSSASLTSLLSLPSPTAEPAPVMRAAYSHDCAICLNTQQGAPQMLGCGHVFCLRCVERHVQTQLNACRTPTCPMCQRPISMEEVVELREVVSAISPRPPLGPAHIHAPYGRREVHGELGSGGSSGNGASGSPSRVSRFAARARRLGWSAVAQIPHSTPYHAFQAPMRFFRST